MNKPPYQVPTLTELRTIEPCGLTHVSTFSGGGGTCLGFKMAGFETCWANDVDPHARECYTRNLQRPIDGTDIRRVTATQILESTGLAIGELDVFEGSPPCTAFSTVGKRAKGWRQIREHGSIVQTNVEDLFFEWLRLLEGLQPRVFMAENVSGMVKGVSKGYFKLVLAEMKRLGYRVRSQLLDAQWLGVPQVRERIIFLGVRQDLGCDPRFPRPLSYRYSVHDVCPTIRNVHQHLFQGTDQRDTGILQPCPTIATLGLGAAFHGRYWVEQIVGNDKFKPRFGSLDQPHPTILAGPNGHTMGEIAITNGQNITRRKFTIEELKRICSFPDDYEMDGSYPQQWKRLGNSVPPLMAFAIGTAIRDILFEIDDRHQSSRMDARA